MASGYLLGLDVGSSSVKASLLDIESGKSIARKSSPDVELPIAAAQPGWAEQHPEMWWEHVCLSILKLRAEYPKQLGAVRAIGISYQMHGLVLLNSNLEPLRPSIIWCDSRAVTIGERAFKEIGPEKCRSKLLNSPGNFTAAKLAWVKENEPQIFKQAAAACLPGDYIALRLTRNLSTSKSGLSEGILWDFDADNRAGFLLEHFGISPDIFPESHDSFSVQGEVLSAVAQELGLPKGVVVAYRAGDQPNNALSLNVLEPEEVAATAGTSGVVYGVTDKRHSDPRSRVNSFLHVNHSASETRLGVLLCVNGTGALYRWLRQLMGATGTVGSYELLNAAASQAPIGANGLIVLPYGNGAERTLDNKDLGASFQNVQFNRHSPADLFRASQEGIVFALNYGLEIMHGMGVAPKRVRAGYANMFLSPIFASTFAGVTGVPVELFDTDGADGAARGAGLGSKTFKSRTEAFRGLETRQMIEPDRQNAAAYRDAYTKWREVLQTETER